MTENTNITITAAQTNHGELNEMELDAVAGGGLFSFVKSVVKSTTRYAGSVGRAGASFLKDILD